MLVLDAKTGIVGRSSHLVDRLEAPVQLAPMLVQYGHAQDRAHHVSRLGIPRPIVPRVGPGVEYVEELVAPASARSVTDSSLTENTSGCRPSASADCSSKRPTTAPPTTKRRAASAAAAALLLARTTSRNAIDVDREGGNACRDLQRS